MWPYMWKHIRMLLLPKMDHAVVCRGYHDFNLAHVPMSLRARTSVSNLWSRSNDTEKEWLWVNEWCWLGLLGGELHLLWFCPRLPHVDFRTNKWCSSLNTTRCCPSDHYFILFKDVKMDFNILMAYRDKDVWIFVCVGLFNQFSLSAWVVMYCRGLEYCRTFHVLG